ncbi:hypothetical protein P0Y43_01965 [Pseudomonas entomophila]|uniref:hypothetical protein n=1 Tax=Pseudomonas entomophila TaxID=312306 RepID=UPI0023D86BBE|nr:hypothetical protein [Pseudomonas entomophila]MDF0729492.1 hypothetical protein [Pseudomonas entomophila]
MTNVVVFVSKETRLAEAVAEQVAQVRAQDPLALPNQDAAIVRSYIEQIEGTYDTARAKTDTDHAIELLYIAYNTTPQAQGEIRNSISSIMTKLIDAQQASQVSINEAVAVASLIDQKLRGTLPDWLDVKDSDNVQEIKDFVAKDLLELAKLIEAKALSVRDKLLAVAADYDKIIQDTESVTQRSEVVLGETLTANKKLADDMLKDQARSEALEALVEDMRKQVEQFQKLAADYAKQAKDSEDRAARASFLQGLFQVVSAVLPIVALATGVGAPAAAAGAVISSVGTRVAAQRSTASEIKMREEHSDLQVQHKQLQQEVRESQEKVDSLNTELKEAGSDAVEGLEERARKAQEGLDAALAKKSKLEADMNELQNALGKLEKIADNASVREETKAKGLRELQLEMVTKAEDYEKKRSEHSAELITLKVLLAGKRDEHETNELAIRSLNLSMSALKRTKEIVEEIAHFFLSFSSFMQRVADDARVKVESYEQVAEGGALRKHKREQLFASTDEFFIEQTARWLAVAKVCEVFAKTFEDGWTKLNTLNGNYVSTDKLNDYLSAAGTKLEAIAHVRDEMKAARLRDLESYRQQIQADAGQA